MSVAVAATLLVGVVPTVVGAVPAAAPAAGELLRSAALGEKIAQVPTGTSDPAALLRAQPKAVSEIVSDRTASSSVFTNDDGSISIHQYAVPHFYQPSGGKAWAPIETTLTNTKDGRWASGANSWSASFGSPASPEGAERLTLAGHAITLTPQAVADPAMTPSVSGSSVTYTSVWPSTDLRETVLPTGVAEDIVLNDASAATTFAFALSGATASPDGVGGLTLRSDGTSVATIPPITVTTQGQPPSAGESATVASGARYVLSTAGITASVSPAWLASLPRSAFPVVIDPEVDTWQSATQAIGRSSAGGSVSGQMRTGYDTSGNLWRGAMYVSKPTLPATLPGGGPWQLAFASYQAICSPCYLDDAVLYGEPNAAGTPPTYASIPTGTVLWQAGTGNRTNALIGADITSWMQNRTASWFGVTALDGTPPNGPRTLLASYPASDDEVLFQYVEAPPPSHLTSPADGAVIATTTPTLTAQVTDPAPPQQVSYDFKLSTTPGGGGAGVIDSGWVNSPSWTVPPGALADGVSYYANVLNIDNSALYDPSSPFHITPIPGPQTSFQVKKRLDAGGPSPTDTVGSTPGSTSTPSQGAPSPGISTASETVNMVTGNLSLALGTRSMSALGGPAGISLTYNSLESSSSSGGNYGINGQYYADDGSHVFPTTPAGARVDPGVDIVPNGLNALTAALPPGSDFMARWTGTLTMPAGTWALGGLSTLGGLRVLVNGSPTPTYNDWTAANSHDGVPHYGAATVSGGTQRYPIEVDAWSEGTVGAGHLLPTIQLWAKNTAVTDPTQQSQFLVPAGWLTPAPSALPPGWDIGPATAAWSRAHDLGAQVVIESQTGTTATFTRLSDGSYQAPPGNNDYLSLRAGALQLATSDDNLYTFNADGSIATLTSVADDRHPTALSYSYSGTPAVLRAITDPVSTRSVNLFYGGDAGCPAVNAAPAGMLCQAANWDGTSTGFAYNPNSQLAAIHSAGGQTTLLGYDSDDRVDDIRDALAVDYIAFGQPSTPSNCVTATATPCTLDTQVAYDAAGRVATVTQPAPAPGALRPARTYAYGTGTTSVAIAGFHPAPLGVASSVAYDAQSRITSQTNATGQASHTVWDSVDQPIVAVDTAGKQTSTVYDRDGNTTDTYGPAPTACFDAATWPTGLPAPASPVVGYLPVASPAGAAGCGLDKVPHSHNAYDEGIAGLAESYWSNAEFAGPVALHATGVGGAHAGCSQAGPLDSSPPPWPAVATDLCGSWSPGAPPVTPDAGGGWSLRMTGTIDWTAAAGPYDFLYNSPLPTSLYIDGALVATNLDPDDPYNPSGVNGSADGVKQMTPGTHAIRLDVAGSNTQSTSYGVIYRLDQPNPGLPDTKGPWTAIGLADLNPHYGLLTSSTDPDGKKTSTSYSSSTVGPEEGLVTSSTAVTGTGDALTTTTAYEAPGPGSYLRRTSTTLPAGNATTYAYYGGGDGPLAAACGATAGTPQGGQLKSQTDPAPTAGAAARTQQFLYDAAGRQVGRRVGPSTTISGAAWQCTSYDDRGRIRTETWPATATAPARTVTYSYALSGNPLASSVTDTNGGVVSSVVDLLGRLTTYTDANEETTTTSYDQAGRVTASNGLQGAIAYGYSADGDPSTIALAGTVLSTSHYDSATNRLTSVTYGNGTTGTVGYDAYGKENALTFANTATGAFLDGNQVTRSAGGRIITELQNINGTGVTNANPIGGNSADYTYDGAGRLTTAAIPGRRVAYGYTANPADDGCAASAGGSNTNRTSVVTIPAAGAITSTHSCYNNADQLTKTITDTTASTNFAYDGHGNQTADDTTTLAWDASDRLITTTTGSSSTVYTYDPLDRVTKRVTGTNATSYSYAGFTDAPAATLDASLDVAQVFLTLPGGVMITAQASSSTWSYPDLHGNYTVTADNAGARQSGPNTYDPWGQPTDGQTPLDNAAGPGKLDAFGGAGKVTDTTSGITIMGARPYNPAEARFLAVDPVVGGCANSYAYAFGDPLNGGDLTGLADCEAHHIVPQKLDVDGLGNEARAILAANDVGINNLSNLVLISTSGHRSKGTGVHSSNKAYLQWVVSNLEAAPQNKGGISAALGKMAAQLQAWAPCGGSVPDPSLAPWAVGAAVVVGGAAAAVGIWGLIGEIAIGIAIA